MLEFDRSSPFPTKKMTLVHRFILENDIDQLKSYLESLHDGDTSPLDEFVSGQTPLTLAVMLGRRECVEILLKDGRVSTLKRNENGWSPLQEAISFGNREILKVIYKFNHCLGTFY